MAMKINFKNFINKIKPGEPGFVYALASLVFVVGLSLIIFFGYQYFSHKNFGTAIINLDNQTTTSTPANCNYRRILDGVCVAMQTDINPKLVAVMIENHSEARPQSGLVDASIVYEAPVEANYTRFLAIYPADMIVKKIGPVRSARPYYLDWLGEYGTPMYMHVGGSPEALDIIKARNIFDLNEFYRGWYYWRSEDRSAPHNAYTSNELWGKAVGVYGEENYLNDIYGGWKFGTTIEQQNNRTTQDLVEEITVSFLPPVYEAVWKYSSTTNQYERYQMNKPHVDQDGRQIVADNVIVQKVQAKVLDEIGRQEITTVGKGDLLVFKNGEVITGYWQKNSSSSRTKFFDNNGEEIKLNSGKIWVEVVSQMNSLSFRTNDSE
ncbi:MAG TPA: hypothetical protein DEB09_02960 [Candidatus Magasanikbacteria bacterium]|nr:hypothetical protein [Candidatus Magasanikbacteria bacterium]